MEKVYKTSRICLSILAAILALIVFLPTGIGCLIAATAVYLLGFPCTKLTEKVIAIGDRIRNRLLNALYFVGLPVIVGFLCFLVIGVTGMVSNQIPTNTISDGIAVEILFMIPLVLFITIAVIVTLQTWIVIVLRLFHNAGEEPDPKRSNEK